jgi:hypothetical protein
MASLTSGTWKKNMYLRTRMNCYILPASMPSRQASSGSSANSQQRCAEAHRDW